MFEVVENTDEGRFELRRDGETISVADFSESDGVVVIPHVGTNPAHRGQGMASRLMDGVIDLLRESDRLLKPLCPFAAYYMRKNPQHHDVLA